VKIDGRRRNLTPTIVIVLNVFVPHIFLPLPSVTLVIRIQPRLATGNASYLHLSGKYTTLKLTIYNTVNNTKKKMRTSSAAQGYQSIHEKVNGSVLLMVHEWKS
jgi:hypothetical protein